MSPILLAGRALPKGTAGGVLAERMFLSGATWQTGPLSKAAEQITALAPSVRRDAIALMPNIDDDGREILADIVQSLDEYERFAGLSPLV